MIFPEIDGRTIFFFSYSGISNPIGSSFSFTITYWSIVGIFYVMKLEIWENVILEVL
jgi:hypothetical protein